MGTVKQPLKRRVMTRLSAETLNRARAEQARIAQETGCKPSISGVVAAAVERGLPR